MFVIDTMTEPFRYSLKSSKDQVSVLVGIPNLVLKYILDNYF